MIVKTAGLKIVFSVFAILVITIFSFLPVLKNNFVNWDDPQYTLENSAIRALTPANLKKAFSCYYASNYQPLTMLSYSLDYHFFKLDPQAYHWTNLILHLLNCLLVFWLLYAFSNSVFIAFLTALFFGIHPLHVESVAWISERKDVLYALFFLGALVSYQYFLRNNYRFKFYCLTFVLFILACLSKSMAVTLPLVLLLFDHFSGRKLDKRVFREKAPFIVIAVIFGFVALFSQYTGGALRYDHMFSFLERMFIFTSGLVFYLLKLIFPLKLSCIYLIPNVSFAEFPKWFLVSPLLVAGIAAIVYYSKKYTGKIVFGTLFFLFTLLPVSQLIPFGNALAADRYTYVPAIGLFFLVAELFCWLYARRIPYLSIWKVVFTVFLIAWVGVLGSLTWQRAQVWKNSLSLFNDVLRQYPQASFAYINRGGAYLELKDRDKAAADFRTAIKLDPNFAFAYVNLCDVDNLSGKYEEAVLNCKTALRLDPAKVKAYFNLGNAYVSLGQKPEAIEVYKKAISLDPDYVGAYQNLAAVYMSLKDYRQAFGLLKKALELNPDLAEAKHNLAIIAAQEKQFPR
ncbi:MAG: tetratricopeptide repeat protein [Candidatus Omnitrophica bacterium]|nr:tetratricopeptide repeat protein [Candidatus Omnitrophota bacterium]